MSEKKKELNLEELEEVSGGVLTNVNNQYGMAMNVKGQNEAVINVESQYGMNMNVTGQNNVPLNVEGQNNLCDNVTGTNNFMLDEAMAARPTVKGVKTVASPVNHDVNPFSGANRNEEK